MKSETATWVRPLDIELLQSIVFERLAKERSAVLLVRGDFAGLSLPQQFERSEDVVVESGRRAFDLNRQSWRLLQSALRKDDWLSERLLEMQVLVDGKLAFLVGDSFHPECVSLRQAAPSSLASKLEESHAAIVYRVA